MTNKKIIELLKNQIDYEQEHLNRLLSLYLEDKNFNDYTDTLLHTLGWSASHDYNDERSSYDTSNLDKHMARYLPSVKYILDTIDGLRRLISEVEAST